MGLATIFYLSAIFWAIRTILFSRNSSHFDTSQFQVHSLPNSPALPPSWAGRLPVPGRQGNDIFFWLFNAEDPAVLYIVWLNGGPGCSSLIGLTTGNGPVSFAGNSTRLVANPHSWTKLGNVLYVDQPIGTGFSTASSLVRSNDQVTTDFALWLHTFFDLFPHLQSKNVHMMGESYAGIFIPYFANALMEGNHSFPINLRSMSLGDGSWGNAAAMSSVAMGTYMHSQKSLLKVPTNILSAFTSADQMCGFDRVLDQANIYPPKGKIHIPGNPEFINYRRRRSLDPSRRDSSNLGILAGTCDATPSTPQDVLSSILNSTCYGPCASFSTAENYMYASSANGSGPACFSIYDLSQTCSTGSPLPLVEDYFSRSDVQSALHVDDTGEYSACNPIILSTLEGGDFVEPPEYSLLPSLVTKHNISLHIYNGELDMLINHIGTELSIQNMTWRGAQGFQREPSSFFYVDDAAPVGAENSTHSAKSGIWTAERGVSYHLFEGAGHSVFATKPRDMFSFVRDVVVDEKAG